MIDSRDAILGAVRSALSRSQAQPIPEPPPLELAFDDPPLADRIASFHAALEKLGGKVYQAPDYAAARVQVDEIVAGRSTVCSQAPAVLASGLSAWTGDLREECSTADCGITSAAYALADTGSLVLFATESEPRMISLLPPCHIAIVPVSKLLTGLNELFTRVPRPEEQSSAMVLITGPSRSADIEMILVRGVHGPGEIHVVFVAD
ncbi:MAG: lactate utilization protein [Bryobacteraceae bacterium]